MIADLSWQQSIRHLVQEFQARHSQLHVLVNNAGVSLTKRVETEDGLETVFATNHLAPFLLTNLLLPVLTASAPARVVTVSSGVESMAKIDFDDLQSVRSYNVIRTYNTSKLANVLFTYELARRLAGTGVTANAVEPGFVKTNLKVPFPFSLFSLMRVSRRWSPADCVPGFVRGSRGRQRKVLQQQRRGHQVVEDIERRRGRQAALAGEC